MVTIDGRDHCLWDQPHYDTEVIPAQWRAQEISFFCRELGAYPLFGQKEAKTFSDTSLMRKNAFNSHFFLHGLNQMMFPVGITIQNMCEILGVARYECEDKECGWVGQKPYFSREEDEPRCRKCKGPVNYTGNEAIFTLQLFDDKKDFLRVPLCRIPTLFQYKFENGVFLPPDKRDVFAVPAPTPPLLIRKGQYVGAKISWPNRPPNVSMDTKIMITLCGSSCE